MELKTLLLVSITMLLFYAELFNIYSTKHCREINTGKPTKYTTKILKKTKSRQNPDKVKHIGMVSS